MAKITVIGSFVIDMTARVEQFPKDGETLIAGRFHLAYGGKGANQALAVRRMGGDAEMIGMVGADEYGKEILKTLRNNGVKCDNVFVSDTLPTGMAHIQIDKNGQNRIVVINGANDGFGMQQLEQIDTVLRNSDMILVQFELPLAVTAEILRRAKRYGVMTILNPAPARSVDIEILKNADYITPNDLELSGLTGMPAQTPKEAIIASRRLLSQGVKNIITTMGKHGALVVTEKYTELLSSFPVEAVDTVGAGDSFNGALAVGLSEGMSILDAVDFANAEGALTVTKEGAFSSIHYRAEVEQFLRANKPSKQNIRAL